MQPLAATGEQAEGKPARKYRRVSRHMASSSWMAELRAADNPLTKRKKYIGRYASEEEAARAYDYAVVQLAVEQLRDPGCTKRNFPDEIISEPPATLGAKQKEHKTSDFTGVGWSKASSKWQARLGAKYIGCYESEEDAARAYDYEVMQLRVPDATLNFPKELVSARPVSLGAKQQERKTSDFTGVSWHKASSAWRATLKGRHIGCYASKEGAAKAYDYEVVQLRVPGAKRNFPNELISEPPVSLADERGGTQGVSCHAALDRGRRAWIR
ncbi:hypothetical protein FOA52_009030 [Chlamydomonas sp. UWO 241]|nr:hypothetical protein FOA52_009030 [Chlamydomonas sp. UWO 241]